MAFVTTRFDEQGRFPWTKIVTTYGDDESIQSVVYHNDDGTEFAYHYAGAVLTRKVTTDSPEGDGQFPFVTKTEFFNDEGRLTETTTVSDFGRTVTTRVDEQGFIVSATIDDGKGVIRDETYEMGIRVEMIEVNLRVGTPESEVAWSMRNTTFEEYSGTPETVTLHFPHGRTVTETYADGILSATTEDRGEGLAVTKVLDIDGDATKIVEEDVSADGSHKAWETRETILYETGEVASVKTVRDDGAVAEAHFANGVITKKTFTDTNGSLPFESRMDIFHAGGRLASRSYEKHDGTSRIDSYQNGRLHTRTETDLEGDASRKSWESVTTTYDSDGDVLMRDFAMDSGGRRIDRYDEDGQRLSSTLTDGGHGGEGRSFRPWEVVTRYFNATSGKVERTEILEDDGDTIIFGYEADGSRDFRIEKDNDGSHPWEVKVRDYRPDGPTVETTYDSASDLPEPYAAQFDDLA